MNIKIITVPWLSKKTYNINFRKFKILDSFLISPRVAILGNLKYSEFNRVNWVPIRFRVQQIVSTDMHRLVDGNAPFYSRDGIFMVTPITPEIGYKSFSYKAVKYWKQLPNPIRATENPLHFRSFKKKTTFF